LNLHNHIRPADTAGHSLADLADLRRTDLRYPLHHIQHSCPLLHPAADTCPDHTLPADMRMDLDLAAVARLLTVPLEELGCNRAFVAEDSCRTDCTP
jgi:hypothetical protein